MSRSSCASFVHGTLAGIIAVAAFAAPEAAHAAAPGVPHLDHIIVVIMENHAYSQVDSFPFTKSLIASGTSFSRSFAITHPSLPNYMCLWAGGTLGVAKNTCPPPGSPFSAENLGHACEAAGLTWNSYCENLPFAGYADCFADSSLYARKHAPWTHFGNLNHMNERPFADLAVAESQGALPNFAFVVPNQCNDTHSKCDLKHGDDWLAQNIPPMIQAVGPSGLVVLTWDEDDDSANNQILTVFCGPQVKGNYVSSQLINHFTVLRAICEGLGLAPFAAAAAESSITDVWVPATSGVEVGTAGVTLGTPFPNPSRGAVQAVLRLPGETWTRADVYDLAGRRVTNLISGKRSGEIAVRWDGRNADGQAVSRGLYLLRVRAGDRVLQQKLARVD